MGAQKRNKQNKVKALGYKLHLAEESDEEEHLTETSTEPKIPTRKRKNTNTIDTLEDSVKVAVDENDDDFEEQLEDPFVNIENSRPTVPTIEILAIVFDLEASDSSVHLADI